MSCKCKGPGLGSSYRKDDNRTTETQIVIDNDQRLYNQKKAIEKGMAKALCRGNFSTTKAKKAFLRLGQEVSRTYVKEYGSPLGLDDRKEAARDMVADFVKGVRAGKGDVHGLGRDVVAIVNKCPAKKP